MHWGKNLLLQELVEDSWLEIPRAPTNKKLSIMKKIFWTPDFTLAWSGMCYTLDIEDSKGNNLIHFFLNINLTFIVFIHDPNYYLNSNNPQTIPMTTWIVPKENRFERLSLVETEHKELNVPADPCEEDINYNFYACIKQSLSTQIGCRSKWDKWTATNLTLCNTMKQFRSKIGHDLTFLTFYVLKENMNPDILTCSTSPERK